MVPCRHVRPPSSRLGLSVHHEPASVVGPAVMEIEMDGTVVIQAALEPPAFVEWVGGLLSPVCVATKKNNNKKRESIQASETWQLAGHEADRPRLITAASHQHEDDPG